MVPQTLIIDGLHWQIDVTTVASDQHGECIKSECRVLIAANLPQQLREVTFWHELVHALFSSRDFEIPAKTADVEEAVATFLGPALYSFFQANAEITWKGQLRGMDKIRDD